MLAYRPLALPRLGVDAMLTVGVAALLSVVAFAAKGGLLLGRTTKVELLLLVGSGLIVGACTLASPRREPLYGLSAGGGFLALALFTVASIAWAAQPDDAWVEANRTLTYVAVFAAALAAVRVLPDRWPALLGGVALGGTVVVGYALATKVFPGALDPDELYARLQPPYDYWNAVGLSAAMAVPPLLWLGARRQGPPPLNALAYPALGLCLVTIMLSYSRGALLVLVVGCAFWFATVPLRLRAAMVLGISAFGALLVTLWTFSQDALTEDRLPLGVRVDAGHRLGLLLVAMVLSLTALGLFAGFAGAVRPLRPLERRRAGIAVLCALALIPIGVGVRLTQTQRGLFGSIGHAVSQLVDPNATVPSNDPSRLTSAGSVRARYWSEALRMWVDHPGVGVGAGGYGTVRNRYRNDTLEVRHAHGYVVQTLADLGVIGMLLSLLALGGWWASTARATGLRRADRGRPYTPERIGLLTMTAVVVTFGVHSFVDWTWFVPGNALVALLCAGWVAGRGPLRRNAAVDSARPVPVRAWRSLERWRVAAAGAALLIALVAAWAVWQPLRSLNASNDGLSALEAGNLAGAKADADTAHNRDPLALDPLTVLAIVQTRQGHKQDALHTLEREVKIQPANGETWLRLADFQLNQLKSPKAALRSLKAALYLNPHDPLTISAYFQTSQRVTGKTPAVPAPAQPQPTQPTPGGQAAPAQPPGSQ